MNLKVSKRTKVLVSVISASAFALGLSSFFLFTSGAEDPYSKYDAIAKAAIIDQLNDDIPNKHFQQKATEYLEAAGYEVDLYTTKDITIDLYKKLPSMGYSLIVFRTHSVAGDNETQPKYVGLFTGERYQTDRYTLEQMAGQLQKGAPLLSVNFNVRMDESGKSTWNVTRSSDPYFLVGSKFVDELMRGKFPQSIMIIGGCETLSNTGLADSLLRRGASAIIGWDNLVGSTHNDKVILEVLKGMLVDKSDVKDVLQSAMQKFGPDPQYSAVLKYYPHSAADTRI